VPVEAGDYLGTSGKSGFVVGGAHLHFEVRHNGRQVDPYGWQGPGVDPCAAWVAGCEASIWLWHDELRGAYDFTAPDADAPVVVDEEPPIGTLHIPTDPDLGLLVHFDNHPVQQIGSGTPTIGGPAGSNVLYEEGVFGEAARVPADLSLTYPVSGNLDLDSGGLAFWAKIPGTYPENGTGRHYLLAASDNPGDSARGVYTGTLALRRETVDGAARWNFWTVADGGERQDLVVADTLEAGWHHFALLWDRHAGEGGAAKQLYIDGELAAEHTGVPWPASVGERLEIGRWTPGYGVSGVAMDELALFGRVLMPDEVGRLAAKQDYLTSESGPLGMRSVTGERAVVLDTNAIDRQGGIVGVRLRRNDEPWSQPLPYYDSYRWQITGTDDVHTFSVEYRDRANNVSVVTATVTLGSVPSSLVRLEQLDGVDPYYRYQALEQLEGDLGALFSTPASGTRVRLHLTPVGDVPAAFQVATSPDCVRAEWQPFVDVLDWSWADGEPQVAYVRFRSRDGVVGPAIMVGNGLQRHYLPLIGN
jgi:hypothetical protein